jgi:hypothetical protein
VARAPREAQSRKSPVQSEKTASPAFGDSQSFFNDNNVECVMSDFSKLLQLGVRRVATALLSEVKVEQRSGAAVLDVLALAGFVGPYATVQEDGLAELMVPTLAGCGGTDAMQDVDSRPVHELKDGRPAQEREPRVVEQEPRVVEQKPRVVVQEPRVVEQKPRVVVQEPRVVEQGPRVVGQKPRVVEQQPRVVVQEPRVVEQGPRVVGQKLRVVEQEADMAKLMVPALAGCGGPDAMQEVDGSCCAEGSPVHELKDGGRRPAREQEADMAELMVPALAGCGGPDAMQEDVHVMPDFDKLLQGVRGEESACYGGPGSGQLTTALCVISGSKVGRAKQKEGECNRTYEVARGPDSLAVRQELEQVAVVGPQEPEAGLPLEPITLTEEEAEGSAELQQLSHILCEQLRLILEPTKAAKLQGDFRTGKRLNMRKIIPYIASQFKEDKIWLRRVKPSKREFQILVALDDSSSMADNKSRAMALQSLATISSALSLLEAGQLGVLRFGQAAEVVHGLGQQWSQAAGRRVGGQFTFDQQETSLVSLLSLASGLFAQHRGQAAHGLAVSQLLVILSDGRGVFHEGRERVTQAVMRARQAGYFVLFLVVENPDNKDSVLDIRLPVFREGKLASIDSYMEHFPFQHYIVLRDVETLPHTLSDALSVVCFRDLFSYIDFGDLLSEVEGGRGTGSSGRLPPEVEASNFGVFGIRFGFGGGRSARCGGPGGGQLRAALCAGSGTGAGLIMLGFRIVFDFGSGAGHAMPGGGSLDPGVVYFRDLLTCINFEDRLFSFIDFKDLLSCYTDFECLLDELAVNLGVVLDELVIDLGVVLGELVPGFDVVRFFHLNFDVVRTEDAMQYVCCTASGPATYSVPCAGLHYAKLLPAAMLLYTSLCCDGALVLAAMQFYGVKLMFASMLHCAKLLPAAMLPYTSLRYDGKLPPAALLLCALLLCNKLMPAAALLAAMLLYTSLRYDGALVLTAKLLYTGLFYDSELLLTSGCFEIGFDFGGKGSACRGSSGSRAGHIMRGSGIDSGGFAEVRVRSRGLRRRRGRRQQPAICFKAFRSTSGVIGFDLELVCVRLVAREGAEEDLFAMCVDESTYCGWGPGRRSEDVHCSGGSFFIDFGDLLSCTNSEDLLSSGIDFEDLLSSDIDFDLGVVLGELLPAPMLLYASLPSGNKLMLAAALLAAMLLYDDNLMFASVLHYAKLLPAAMLLCTSLCYDGALVLAAMQFYGDKLMFASVLHYAKLLPAAMLLYTGLRCDGALVLAAMLLCASLLYNDKLLPASVLHHTRLLPAASLLYDSELLLASGCFEIAFDFGGKGSACCGSSGSKAGHIMRGSGIDGRGFAGVRVGSRGLRRRRERRQQPAVCFGAFRDVSGVIGLSGVIGFDLEPVCVHLVAREGAEENLLAIRVSESARCSAGCSWSPGRPGEDAHCGGGSCIGFRDRLSSYIDFEVLLFSSVDFEDLLPCTDFVNFGVVRDELGINFDVVRTEGVMVIALVVALIECELVGCELLKPRAE